MRDDDRGRIILGFAGIAMILGSGILMSLFLLRRQQTQVSADDWRRLNTTVAQLVEHENLQATASQATSPAPTKAASLTSETSVAINTATVAELDGLPGIGDTRAKALVAEREARGPFRDLDDIRARVPKIPASVLQKISEQITF